MNAKERTDDYMRALYLDMRAVNERFIHAEKADDFHIIDEIFKDCFERYAEDLFAIHWLKDILFRRALEKGFELNNLAFIYTGMQQMLVNYLEFMEFDDPEEE